MEISLLPDLAAALSEEARRLGVTPEVLAINTLREQFLASTSMLEPQDEWERRLRALGTDCGVSLPDSAFTSEELYD